MIFQEEMSILNHDQITSSNTVCNKMTFLIPASSKKSIYIKIEFEWVRRLMSTIFLVIITSSNLIGGEVYDYFINTYTISIITS